MKTLNNHSTRIFFSLVEKLGDKDRLKIENEPFMPLVIAHEGYTHISAGTQASVYSLYHFYQQDGREKYRILKCASCIWTPEHREPTG